MASMPVRMPEQVAVPDREGDEGDIVVKKQVTCWQRVVRCLDRMIDCFVNVFVKLYYCCLFTDGVCKQLCGREIRAEVKPVFIESDDEDVDMFFDFSDAEKIDVGDNELDIGMDESVDIPFEDALDFSDDWKGLEKHVKQQMQEVDELEMSHRCLHDRASSDIKPNVPHCYPRKFWDTHDPSRFKLRARDYDKTLKEPKEADDFSLFDLEGVQLLNTGAEDVTHISKYQQALPNRLMKAEEMVSPSHRSPRFYFSVGFKLPTSDGCILLITASASMKKLLLAQRLNVGRLFKKFVMGSDEYRNQRLKVVPDLVQAPAAAKIFTPVPGLVGTDFKIHYNYKRGRYLEALIDINDSKTWRGSSAKLGGSLFMGKAGECITGLGVLVEAEEKNNEELPERLAMAVKIVEASIKVQKKLDLSKVSEVEASDDPNILF
ncbi:protein ENHANCED DISEASE RESISTANCE 2-like [Elysia marginata]|uniref:Protein ENHANCED DISEASE RESISTANCE 2-like n=1 Tax=Elysia marginata TaxID=1093978 RepID=A0AAV4IMZ1_9GAST|nr:protein ENHANCED DISEASE RESISTANCE 2-like [Elysia marginata]